MDFLHPPMLPGPQEEEQLFATYLHPPMALQEDSPMAPMSSLHPPMLPSDNYHQQQQHQMQSQGGQVQVHGQGQQGQNGQNQNDYYDSNAQQQSYDQGYN